ncbi:MAG: hypothetical protein ABIH00_09840 [Armatimonadota bacterium]
MAVRKNRIPVTLESVLYEWILSEAKRQGISISQAIRDAVKLAYEWSATFEVLSSEELTLQLQQSGKGSAKHYVPFDEVKRDVYRRSK